MILNLRVLLCTLAVFAVLHSTVGKRSYGGGRGHSYPKSGGLSGGGHGYPQSGGGHGGMSGGGHGYPNSGGTSGGAHGYPNSGGTSVVAHGYPNSGGTSGGTHGYPNSGGTSGGAHGYPNSGGMSGGSHGYPNSGGMSGGGHGYPAGKGLSGNTQPSVRYPTSGQNYKYSPPQQISYTPVHGRAPVNYPVYHGPPPSYVYQYKNSGSKYGTLLTGLALLNLGALAGAGTAYAVTHSHGGSGSSGTGYKAQPGEICKFAIRKDNGDYEETKIDCQLISSFILQDQHAKQQNATSNAGSVTTTTTVTNVTVVNTTNGEPAPPPAPADATVGNTVYTMFPNGTLVPFNMTNANATNATNATAPEASSNPVASSVTVTTTTTNTTVTDALSVKGSPVQVTPGMKCYVIRLSPTSNMRKTVECGLLQTYADKSIRPNSAARHAPVFTIMAAIVAFILY